MDIASSCCTGLKDSGFWSTFAGFARHVWHITAHSTNSGTMRVVISMRFNRSDVWRGKNRMIIIGSCWWTALLYVRPFTAEIQGRYPQFRNFRRLPTARRICHWLLMSGRPYGTRTAKVNYKKVPAMTKDANQQPKSAASGHYVARKARERYKRDR